MRAWLALRISVSPLGPMIENWKSFQRSSNTAPLNDRRLSSQVVFQPNSKLSR